MPDVTERVMEVTGRYPHHGKFEGGTGYDEAASSMEVAEYHGSTDEGGYIGLVYFSPDPNDFLTGIIGEPSEREFVDAHHLAEFVRSAVFVEDSAGFVFVRYFDSQEDGETYFGKITHELYPHENDPHEILREVD